MSVVGTLMYFGYLTVLGCVRIVVKVGTSYHHLTSYHCSSAKSSQQLKADDKPCFGIQLH